MSKIRKSLIALAGLVATSVIIDPTYAQGADPLVYLPVDTPCRLTDTRNTAGPNLIDNIPRNFFAFGDAAAIAAQGGNVAGCDHPRSGEGVPPATIAATVTAVGKQASGNGNIVAYPAGAAVPGTSTVNYTQTANIANTTLIALCTAGCPPDGDFTLLSNFSNVPAIVDVVGYYYPTQVIVTGIYTGIAVGTDFDCTDPANNAVVGVDAVLNINNQIGNDFSGTVSLTQPGVPAVITVTLDGTVYPFGHLGGTFDWEIRASGIVVGTSAGEFMGTVARMSETVTLQIKGNDVTGETCKFLASIYVDR